MATAKRILLILFFSGTHAQLFAQEVPTLNENDLIHQEDLKKKAGWMRIALDSNFQSTSINSSVKYQFYEFINKKGQYNLTYAKKLPFPKNMKVTYRKDAPSTSDLISGVVTFYDKANTLLLQYIFKNGFYVKTSDYKSGKMKTLIEYIPKKNSVELFANYFDATGNIYGTSHEENDGYKYITLPEQKIITQTSY